MVSKNFSNRANELKKERRKTELLLNEMLPKLVAKALRSGKPVSAEFYHSVSIMFTDIANFQEISSLSKPMDLITLLNNVYNFIDAKIELHDVYKVETVGSVYMVAAGVPIRSDGHAKEVANLALDVKDATEDFVIPHLPERNLLLRIGAHCGSVVGGVVGNKCPRYCLFGDTVNTASRMQSSGSAAKIHVSGAFQEALASAGWYVLKYRGEIQVKGKGIMQTYWLESTSKTSKRKNVRMKVEQKTLLDDAW
ncbi:DgyrCDS2954 [Dimorphilus gyrociliatus]|uniref:DgyrCDS2954 n=1 Tax=Dimorphilus gyrociliatus TaxID=2664684 RepID=A0A7I8VBR4_9ANNE|nr:DgyrCDS2954 [Dimorphilus gyrociliatus]